MTSILVTGSSRGIGLELVKRLATHSDPPTVIIATCRDPSKAEELNALARKYENVKVLQLDVDKIDTYSEVVIKISSIVGENGLNILINNAGIAKKRHEIEEVTYDDLSAILKTNYIAPVLFTKACLPLLKKSAAKKVNNASGIKQSAILNMSSVLGSVSIKQPMTSWGYNESKSALNQATRSLSQNLSKYGILVLSLHPGWVRTDMGGPDAAVSVEESCSGLINIIYSLSPDHNDKFLRYDGCEIPW